MKKILLVNYFYGNFTGSELIIKQLADLFHQQDYEIHIAAISFGGHLIANTDTPVKYIDLFNIHSFTEEYDLVWAHHSTILTHCLFEKNLRYKQLILSILSPYEPMESIPAYFEYVDLIVANSLETKLQILEETNLKANPIRLFPNSVPAAFFKSHTINGTLKKIAIVSNHVPQELRELYPLLQADDIQLDIYGMTDNYQEITPEILMGYDLVITIGRTVQLCFALGIPVFVYDQFGGPGYLSASSYRSEEKCNFSGRSTPTSLSAEQLHGNILSGYTTAIQDLDFFNQLAHKKYHFENNLSATLKLLASAENPQENPCSYIQKNFLYLKRSNRNYFHLLRHINGQNRNNKFELRYHQSSEYLLIEEAINIEETIEFSCPLPTDALNQTIRIDPADNMIKVLNIQELSLSYQVDGQTYTKDLLHFVTGNYRLRKMDYCIFDTADPQLYINCSIPQHSSPIEQVSLKIRYHLLAS